MKMKFRYDDLLGHIISDHPGCCCKGGGGGGGSGEVDYPEYMKTVHADWLGGGDSDGSGMSTLSAGNDLTALLDDAVGSSPFTGLSAYDPSTEVGEMTGAVDTYETYVNSIATTSQVETELAKFDAGMRNINAVHSSAFAIGRQIVASGLIEAKLQAKAQVMNSRIEANRMKIVALVEQTNTDRKIDKQDALWDLEVFQSGANAMASIGGGTVQKAPDGPSDMQSALAGGLSGAAAGAAIGAPTGIGAPIGAAVGAVVGIGASLLG